eukprot:3493566-Rhodomonas_salina.1
MVCVSWVCVSVAAWQLPRPLRRRTRRAGPSLLSLSPLSHRSVAFGGLRLASARPRAALKGGEGGAGGVRGSSHPRGPPDSAR